MFTGIVTAQGTVASVSAARLTVDVGPLVSGIEAGGSVSVNGTCLTVVGLDGETVLLDVVTETLERTNLGSLSVGDLVNLERPVGPADLFEGHIVQGHIDGIATVRTIEPEGESLRVGFDLAPELLRYVVEKGSVALNGVSLTVTAVDDGGFEVALIPYTIDATNLGRLVLGSAVNVELDVIAKYVERLAR